ncbi:MAG: hypothetical protein AB8W37_02325 [Arsenophonus endosymbiont of Dermacentor nuttalli]
MPLKCSIWHSSLGSDSNDETLSSTTRFIAQLFIDFCPSGSTIFYAVFLTERVLTNLSLKGITILLLTLCLAPLIVIPPWQSTSQFIALSAVELFIGLTMVS